MTLDEMRKILHSFINDYLDGKRDKSNTAFEVINSFELDDVLDSGDELIANSYYALKYLDDDWETSLSELIYLNECFKGDRTFSPEDRDKYITQNTINEKEL